MNIPLKYLPKRLTKKDRKVLRKELKKSRKGYKKGKYITRKKVKSFKSKKSQHILNAENIYKLKNLAVNKELVKKTGCSSKSLNAIIKKGQGAYYSSGSRPNQTPHSWGYARLGSSISGGKASAVDFNILLNGCSKNSKALRLAKNARNKFGYGTRKVAKTKLF